MPIPISVLSTGLLLALIAIASQRSSCFSSSPLSTPLGRDRSTSEIEQNSSSAPFFHRGSGRREPSSCASFILS